AQSTSTSQLRRIPSVFDAKATGEFHGQVTWEGEVLAAPPFETQPVPLAGEILGRKQIRPNPNVPTIDRKARGVRNAVVYLRDVDFQTSKPWDHPPVRVEMRDCQFHIIQGLDESAIGFVRRGEPVRMVSADSHFHMLHADGTVFWNFAFPDPGM